MLGNSCRSTTLYCASTTPQVVFLQHTIITFIVINVWWWNEDRLPEMELPRKPIAHIHGKVCHLRWNKDRAPVEGQENWLHNQYQGSCSLFEIQGQLTSRHGGRAVLEASPFYASSYQIQKSFVLGSTMTGLSWHDSIDSILCLSLFEERRKDISGLIMHLCVIWKLIYFRKFRCCVPVVHLSISIFLLWKEKSYFKQSFWKQSLKWPKEPRARELSSRWAVKRSKKSARLWQTDGAALMSERSGAGVGWVVGVRKRRLEFVYALDCISMLMAFRQGSSNAVLPHGTHWLCVKSAWSLSAL